MKGYSEESAFLATLQASNLAPEDKSPEMLLAAVLEPLLRHPFWELDWDQAMQTHVLVCCLALLLAGLLCSAGGIGGGGIYVTVLMVVGALTPRDAVPLSKAIVFFGSLASLALNMSKQNRDMDAGRSRALIDVTICRLVIPSALAGTLLGVLLNRTASDSFIVVLLSLILFAMTGMVSWTAWGQYAEETSDDPKTRSSQAADAEQPASNRSSGAQDASHPLASSLSRTSQRAPMYGLENDQEARGSGDAVTLAVKEKQLPRRQDSVVSVSMLLLIIVSGVWRFHAGACLEALQESDDVLSDVNLVQQACHHPAVYLLGESLTRWMKDESIAGTLLQCALALPLFVCMAVMMHSTCNCVTNDGWRWVDAAKFQAMGVTTGCLAGLVGIGGGLIFSPFFLIMGVEPAVAVATSSTCVIFTSSSTTMQYLLTDRIIMSLTLVYGLVNLLASYAGTAFVHFLSERYGARRSYITGIVATGVAISAGLCLVKLPIAAS